MMIVCMQVAAVEDDDDTMAILMYAFMYICCSCCARVCPSNRLFPLQALLRIVKHCEDSLPAASTGALLGLDVPRGEGQGMTMQISYAFALPRGRDGGGYDGQVSAIVMYVCR